MVPSAAAASVAKVGVGASVIAPPISVSAKGSAKGDSAVAPAARPSTTAVSDAPAILATVAAAPAARSGPAVVTVATDMSLAPLAAAGEGAQVSVPDAASMTASLAGAAGADRTAPPAATQVNAPVGTLAFASELGDRVAVLVDQKLTHAQIKVSPADLGPIEIKIAIADGKANVSFMTHSHVTRAALEASAPQLRDALSAQGYASVNVDVAQQQFRDRAPQAQSYETEPMNASSAPLSAAIPQKSAVTRPGSLRLDAYA